MHAKLSHNPQRNFTELVADIDGAVSKQRVLAGPDSVTLYTKDGSKEFSVKIFFNTAIVVLVYSFFTKIM